MQIDEREALALCEVDLVVVDFFKKHKLIKKEMRVRS